MTDTTCPLCSSDNHCTADEHCWCMTAHVSEEALQAVPVADQNRRCLCIDCATDKQAQTHQKARSDT